MTLLRKIKIYYLTGEGLSDRELNFVNETEKIFSNIYPYTAPKYYGEKYQNKVFFCTNGKPDFYKDDESFYLHNHFQYKIYRDFEFVKVSEYSSINVFFINKILMKKEIHQNVLALNYMDDVMKIQSLTIIKNERR